MKKFSACMLVVFLAAFPAVLAAGQAKPAGPLAGKKILLAIALRNFQDREFQAAKNAFEAAGAAVTVASSEKGVAVGMAGSKAAAGTALAEARAADYQAVVFIGGSGSTVLWDDPSARVLARDAVAQNKVLGAICLAPVVLARAGVLKGKNATVWPDAAGELKAAGARYMARAVVTDGRIVTGNGPDAAEAFAAEIIRLLK